MHTPPQADLHLLQLGLHALANRLPKHQKPPLLRLPADVREAEEIEGLRLAQTGALSIRRRVASELEEPRLFRVQLQLELLHSFHQFRPEPFGLVFELESNHDVVGITHHDHIAVRPLLTPCLNPEIEDVMEVDIRVAFGKGGVLHSWKSDLEIASKNLVSAGGGTKDFEAVAEIQVNGRRLSVGIEYERSPKAVARYSAIREVLDRDETTDAILYLTANDDILYLLAMELRATHKRLGFVLSDSFCHSLLETRTLTNSGDAEVVPLRTFLANIPRPVQAKLF
jgi:hypothetical protein